MSTQHESSRAFRFSHGGAGVVFGLIAAGSTILSAMLIFGPLADQKVLLMSGSSSRSEPGMAAASTPLRVASVDRRAER